VIRQGSRPCRSTTALAPPTCGGGDAAQALRAGQGVGVSHLDADEALVAPRGPPAVLDQPVRLLLLGTCERMGCSTFWVAPMPLPFWEAGCSWAAGRPSPFEQALLELDRPTRGPCWLWRDGGRLLVPFRVYSANLCSTSQTSGYKDQTLRYKDQTSRYKDQTSRYKDQTSRYKDQTLSVVTRPQEYCYTHALKQCTLLEL